LWEVAKAEVLKKRTVVSHGPDREVSHIMAGGNVKIFFQILFIVHEYLQITVSEILSSHHGIPLMVVCWGLVVAVGLVLDEPVTSGYIRTGVCTGSVEGR